MTWYELAYSCCQWFFPALYPKVRKILKEFCKQNPGCQLLDVGGRKSPYTSNVNCHVHIIDLPRESEVQHELGLGLTDKILAQTKRRRSNIVSIRLEDITQTTLKDNTYDGVVSVEVIEHVPDDSAFVNQIHRVLKPGGTFVLTTPNGVAVPNKNPDHIRHYAKAELESKLKEYFKDVQVFHGVRMGYLHKMSMKRWITKNPLEILQAPWVMLCTFLANLFEGNCSTSANNTCHLFAICKKES